MFDQDLFNRWDLAAKRAVSGHLTVKGYEVTEGTKYGIDLHVSGESRTFDLDVEVRRLFIWTGGQFPFPTVEFPSRKAKYSGDNCYLAVVNPALNACFVVRADTATCSPWLPKECGRGTGEFVMSVPIQSGWHLNLAELVKDTS